jgi:peroxiredoxin
MTTLRTRVGVLGAILVAAAAGRASALNVGEKAPTFTLAVAGDTRRLSLAEEVSGNALTVVMFISTRCPVSNAYDIRMEDLERAFGSRRVRFIGVNSNVNEPPAEIAAHARQHAFTFPVVKDEGSRIADAYGAQHTPEIFVIDSADRALPRKDRREHGRRGLVVRPDALDALSRKAGAVASTRPSAAHRADIAVPSSGSRRQDGDLPAGAHHPVAPRRTPDGVNPHRRRCSSELGRRGAGVPGELPSLASLEASHGAFTPFVSPIPSPGRRRPLVPTASIPRFCFIEASEDRRSSTRSILVGKGFPTP